ncbi:hypothetical protein CKO_01598 [Citrobacter koseri ATCC BAA-895]|uniref:Uncharacterized protein n=1 Tax=Citrobacter koseri (strain ATCC BAA-895 / CDC 4225-83 / SGSC4696) TaxID=290338 RepID=A8AGW7_CITK8|nr:hypothetical protein CKO_01598 [Citrobacter koseri ATCC BAA-895]
MAFRSYYPPGDIYGIRKRYRQCCPPLQVVLSSGLAFGYRAG